MKEDFFVIYLFIYAFFLYNFSLYTKPGEKKEKKEKGKKRERFICLANRGYWTWESFFFSGVNGAKETAFSSTGIFHIWQVIECGERANFIIKIQRDVCKHFSLL